MGWVLQDDVSGGTDNVESVTLGYKGKAYVLDLGAENDEKLAAALAPYLEAAFEYGELPEAPEGPRPVVKRMKKPAPPARPAPVEETAPRRNGRGRTRVPAAQPRKDVVKDAVEPPAKPEIRTWANENGFNVSTTGRVPAAVRKAYEEAFPGA